MKAQELIKNEMDFRLALVEDQEFRILAVEMAKKLNITAKEWNENKVQLLLFFANEVIAQDNKNGSKLRKKLNFN